jgi:SAM-dependent methyltransferase
MLPAMAQHLQLPKLNSQARAPAHIHSIISNRLPEMNMSALPISNNSFPAETLPLPPPNLRERVHGAQDAESFLLVGQNCMRDVVAGLKTIGRDLASFHRILDFGCGSARTLRWFADRSHSHSLYGTDIDGEAIAWCQQNLPIATFSKNDALPPLQYPSAEFDLIYAISVFTHLDEDYQFQWLAELTRICKRKGIVMLTLHGDFLHTPLSPQLRWLLKTKGFAFVQEYLWKDVFPDWYQNSYHTREYIYKWYPRFLRIVSYLPRGLNNQHDLVILQKD